MPRHPLGTQLPVPILFIATCLPLVETSLNLNAIIRVDVKIQSDHNCQCTLKVSSSMQMNYLKQQTMIVSHHILNHLSRIAVHLGM